MTTATRGRCRYHAQSMTAHRTPRPLLSALLVALVCAATAPAHAAPLDVTPDTLIERANLLRDASERPWDPATGRLGNLRQVHIIANDCTVRVVSGAENRLFLGHGTFQAVDTTYGADREGGRRPRLYDVTISATQFASAVPRVGADNTAVCFTLQLATAHELLLRGDHLKVLFDRVDLPVLRMSLNPSHGMKLWFHEVRLGLLSIGSNASVVAGGTGQVQWLQLASSQSSTSLLFHDMEARHAGVSTTTTKSRFSLRIGADTDAGYYQPARAAGDLARLYPIWIDGPVSALKVPAGNVYPLPLTSALRDETRALQQDVMGAAGPRPVLPAPGPGTAPPPGAQATGGEPVSPRQRVSDVLQPLLPRGVTLGKIDLWKDGAALEGRAPDDLAVRQWVQALQSSGEVRNPQVAWMRREADQVAYRVLVTFLCAAPGDRSVCLPATGSDYTQQQVDDALRPVLGNAVTLKRLVLRDAPRDGKWVELEGSGSEAEVRAALERVRQQVPWLQASSAGIGQGTFSARLRMVCAVPPRATPGICAAPDQRR